jgi:hypothetical protein
MRDIFEFRGPTHNSAGQECVASYEHRHAKAAGYRPQHSRNTKERTAQAYAAMVQGWADYAEAYRAQNSEQNALDEPALIGNDGYAASEWEAIGRALLALLNMDNGGFDGGSMDHNIRETMREHGIEEE